MYEDDYESEQKNEEISTNIPSKFSLKKLEFGEENETILAMTTSKNYIFFLTKEHNILLVNSKTLEYMNESHSLPKPKEKNEYQEKDFDKIWTDLEGIHCIIRHNNSIYYLNSNNKNCIELEMFKDKEICAVALDDRNTNNRTTNYFLAVDYNNKIYQCRIDIEKNEFTEQDEVKEHIEKLMTLKITDSDEEENFDKKKSILDRIYGIKFTHATNETLDKSKDSCYIIAVTRNKLYQFKGPGSSNFKQILSRYSKNKTIVNDACKYFPKTKNQFKVEFDILYSNEKREVGKNKFKNFDVFKKFGWRTGSGYCFGDLDVFEYSSGLPKEIEKFTVVPFHKITDKGIKEINASPISVVHTVNHIYILYSDSLTVLSKITSNIIHTEYLDKKYNLMILDKYANDKGVLLLSSEDGVDQISLENENVDIWRDYLDIGDFASAKHYCPEEFKKKINRLDAENQFKINMVVGANKYAFSDEKLEIVCLKCLLGGNLEALHAYLETYKVENIKEADTNREQALQLNLIITWLIELFLSKDKTDKQDFNNLIKLNKKYIEAPELIYQILLDYGKMTEYEEFSSILEDYKRVVVHHINQGQIGKALSFLTNTSLWLVDSPKENMNLLISLGNIFLENSHFFFQNIPIDAFDFLNSILIKSNVEIDNYIENVILALMSRTDKDVNRSKNINILSEEEKIKFNKETKCILDNLKNFKDGKSFHSYVKKQIKGQMNNIHNLYILYLSLNPSNKDIINRFLKNYLESDANGKKTTISFQLDYAKTLLKDNKIAYSYILALMGKYSEAISYILKKDENDENKKEIDKIKLDTAELIANNAPDKKLKKALWIQIFKSIEEKNKKNNNNNEEKLTEALKIMDKSKVLKIEDVLPYITDSIKIEEFKTHISDCISQYEKNINELKDNIKCYNKTAENIKEDINKVKKKPMELRYNEFKCEICKELIRNKRIYLFPCGHMFDMDCIRKRLLDYENTGLDYLHDDNVQIDKLFYELGYIPKLVFKENYTDEMEKDKIEETKKGEETMKKIGGIFNKLKNEFNIGGPKKAEIKKIKEQKEKKYLPILNEILNKSCVLCGNFLVDSVQCSLDDDNAEEPNFNL